MNKWIVCLLLISCLTSCKNKKLDSTKAYFSVVDYLKSEIKKMDSLPLHYKKISVADHVADTTAITKEEFHKYAKEFLDIPDIASSSKMDDYAETNSFDEILNNVLLMYTSKQPGDQVKSETIMMEPDDAGNTHVKTILVNTAEENDGSAVEKNMTWHMDKRFQIVTKINQPSTTEKINTVIISWE